jgi:hypothetical protein
MLTRIVVREGGCLVIQAPRRVPQTRQTPRPSSTVPCSNGNIYIYIYILVLYNGIVNEQLNKVVLEGLSGVYLVWQQLEICFNSVKPFVLAFNPHVGLGSSNK